MMAIEKLGPPLQMGAPVIMKIPEGAVEIPLADTDVLENGDISENPISLDKRMAPPRTPTCGARSQGEFEGR